LRVSIVAIVLASASSACGAAKDAVGSASTDGLTKSPIKIGLMISKTGPSASSDKDGADVATAWQQWVNANGGIAGHPVSVVIADDKGDGATALAGAKSLVADPGVLVLTSQESNTETTVSSYLKTVDVAIVGATGYSPTIWGALPNYFSTSPAGFPTDVLAQFVSAKAVGATKWTAVSCAEIAACKATEPMYSPAAAQQGLSYIGAQSVSSTAASYTAECLKMIRSGADFIQIAVSPAAAKRLIADCKAQGYAGWYGATAGSVNADLTGVSGLRLAGGLQGFPWWADTPAVKQYQDAMAKYQPKADRENPGATSVWAALELIRKALANVGDNPTRQDVFTGLYGLHDEDLGGLLPQKMTYTKGAGAPQVLCAWLYKLENGKFSSARQSGPSGNSVASGDLKSDCVKPLG
jgi:branched-chain amino acid transport system substrate-binding protein